MLANTIITYIMAAFAMLVPLLLGKLAAGVTAVILALLMTSADTP